MTSLAPHLNLIISLLGREEPQPTTKTHKTQAKPTYTQVNTQIQKTTSMYNNTIHIYTTNSTDNKHI